MHASLEQLLAKRDCEPLDAAVVTHIETCGQCRDALARLEATRRELSELPELVPPEGVWSGVAVQVAAEGRRPWRWLAAAGIAATTLMIALFALRGIESPTPAAEQAVVVPELAPVQRDALTLLADRSRLMENQLRLLRRGSPAVVRVGHQLGRAQVDVRLRALDYGINRSNGAQADDALKRAYWNERVRLLDSMLQMERAELIKQDRAAYQVVPVANRQ